LADDGLYGFELWKSDGTAGGTVRVKDINPGANWAFSDASPPSLTNVRGTLFFAADDGTNGRELWKSNGTDAGYRPGEGHPTRVPIAPIRSG
jgi:ELWxxDGT repeat protein